ncbi:biliverdin-producing heme oxygenase [Streptomyces pimonensis]|uniref:Biliverdin-producing heme oxygenase n=1 Tax=Streptomyces pimonensis TaxID=2860288 RepID=A0ABV4J5S7_9ACTN
MDGRDEGPQAHGPVRAHAGGDGHGRGHPDAAVTLLPSPPLLPARPFPEEFRRGGLLPCRDGVGGYRRPVGKGDGVRFHVLEEIPDPTAFKRGYRELLDAVPVDDLERQRVVSECKRAFVLHTDLFRALDEEFPLPA